MRTKTVTIEGRDFTIAPLNMVQVEALIDGDAPAPGDMKAWRQRAWQTVCEGLNNAISTFHNGARVTGQDANLNTVDRLREQFDLATFNGLHSAILEFSCLKAQTPGEIKPEPEPASESISGLSAVA